MKSRVTNNILVEAIQNIYTLLDSKQRKGSIFIFLLLFVNAGIDVIGLGAIYPLIDAALNPGLIQEKAYLKYLYELIGVNDSTTFVLVLSWIVLGVLIIKNAMIIGITYLQTNYSHKIALSLNKKMFLYYYKQGFLFLNDRHSAMYLHNIRTAPKIFAGEYFMRTLFTLTELVVILFIIISLIIYDPIVIILFVFIVLPIFLSFYFITKSKVKKIGAKKHQIEIQSSTLILESIKGYVEIKLANKENKCLNQFSLYQENLMKLLVKERIYTDIPRQLYDIVLVFGVISILMATSFFEDADNMMASTLSVFALAAYRLIPAIGKIVASLVYVKNATPQIKPILVLRDYKATKFKIVERLPFNKKLIFKNISFAYPSTKEKKLLKNINFQVKKGQTIGFVGESGSGKTTLIHLLLRLIKEDNGYITIDGQQLLPTLNAAFQKNIGYVQQDVFIKDGTLKENIAFGEEIMDINNLLLIKSLKEAMLTDFVANHPKGLDMQLGENGVRLSGGQKQRVGIARALYKQAEILVFDEATSALDMDTEATIIETINGLSKTDKTIFIIAHRITTLSSCDSIYELEKGTIKRAISYQELYQEKIELNKNRIAT